MRRSPTGCLTCRIRKVKCDEAKPKCRRCTSTGRTCDGYSTLPFSRNDLLAASRSGVSPTRGDGTSDSSSSLVPRLVTNDAFRRVADKRYFEFFRRCTVASTNLTVDSRFWDSLVIQACDAEPAIKHAVLTIASYHNSIITRNDNDISQQHRAYSEQQYQRALGEAKQLIAVPSNKHIDRILMVCVLFIVFENLRGNYAASQKHMDSGRTIASQFWGAETKTSQTKKSRDIAEVFARLDIFAVSFQDATALYRYTLGDLFRTAPELQPSPYNSIHEAHVSLMDLIRWLLVAGGQMPYFSTATAPVMSYYRAQLAECRQRLSVWNFHWNKFIELHPQTDDIRSKMVQLWYHKAIALIDGGFGSETRYDPCLPHFERIVELSEDITFAINKTPTTAGLSLDLGYLSAIFFCAIRCRDPSLRRRAIRVLESHPRQEGMWESTVAGAIATRWMQMEEEGLGEITSAAMVPEARRIAVLNVQVDTARSKADLRFTTASALGQGQAYRYERLQWN